MAEKISTVPFGAEIPPDLADLFDKLVTQEGWTKKRALAAALRSFVVMDADDRRECYRRAYDADTGEPEPLNERVRSARSQAKSKRKSSQSA